MLSHPITIELAAARQHTDQAAAAQARLRRLVRGDGRTRLARGLRTLASRLDHHTEASSTGPIARAA